MSELSTDLQFARSEAVSRNAIVRITLGTYCYVITAQPDGSSPTSSCTQTGNSTIGASATEIKTVQLSSGAPASFSPNSSLSWIEFDPVRGIATFSTGATTGSVNVNSSDNSSQLTANVSTVGRVCVSSPTNMAGYPSTCS
jgi:Tfp pilus assembly protein FimT